MIQEAVAHSDHLKDADCVRLIESVQKCILHVIGDRSNNSTPSSAGIGTNSRNLSSSDISYYQQIRISHSMSDSRNVTDSSLTEAHTRFSGPQLSDSSETKGAYTRSSSISSQNKRALIIKEPPRVRFSESCLRADKMREDVLLSKRYIGKILDIKRPDYIFTTTEVSFRWQLGLLIGIFVNKSIILSRKYI